MKNKKLLIAATSIMSAAVIAAGASGTAAWFIANRTVKLNVSNIGLKSSVGDLKIEGITFFTDNSVTETYGNDKTIANLNMNNKLITATSSKTGKTHCKMKQTGNVVNFIDTTTIPTKKSADYIQFAVKLANYNTDYIQDVVLDVKLCSIEAKDEDSGDAYTMTRVAVDSLVSTAPTEKNASSAAVLMQSTQTDVSKHKWAITSDVDWELEKINKGTEQAPDYQWSWVTGKDPENPTAEQTGKGYGAYDSEADKYFIPKFDKDSATIGLGTIAKATSASVAGNAWTVVTIWFEGTELLDQNENLPDILNVTLAFTSSDKVTA